MGLAAPKKRTRIANDPNNTRWTRNETSFGKRIMQKQGWTPGSYLGASNAAHAAHFTAANASHVRVKLKEDNLGLGARTGENAERFGLAMFSGLLGRLNGKQEGKGRSEKMEQAVRDVKLQLWQEGRYGGVRFVSAGFLVGDEIKALRREQIEGQGTKRKSADMTRSQDDGAKRRKVDVEPAQSAQDKAAQPSKCEAKHVGDTATPQEITISATSDVQQKPAIHEGEATRSAKEARKAERAEKRKRKEERREKRRLKAVEGTISDSKATTGQSTSLQISAAANEENNHAAVTRHTVSGNRGLVRQRWVQQKRMATMDQKALNEIFMIKMQG